MYLTMFFTMHSRLAFFQCCFHNSLFFSSTKNLLSYISSYFISSYCLIISSLSFCFICGFTLKKQLEGHLGGSVGWRPTSTQVMISRFVSWSPGSGSALTARSLEPASDSVFPSLSAPTLLMLARACALSLSQK